MVNEEVKRRARDIVERIGGVLYGHGMTLDDNTILVPKVALWKSYRNHIFDYWKIPFIEDIGDVTIMQEGELFDIGAICLDCMPYVRRGVADRYVDEIGSFYIYQPDYEYAGIAVITIEKSYEIFKEAAQLLRPGLYFYRIQLCMPSKNESTVSFRVFTESGRYKTTIVVKGDGRRFDYEFVDDKDDKGACRL